MNKRVAEILSMMLVVVVFVGALCACSYVETHYTRKDCVVVEVERQTVTVEDGAGYLWCYDVEGTAPSVGTVVDLHMHNNNTDNTIYDDMILDVTTH